MRTIEITQLAFNAFFNTTNSINVSRDRVPTFIKQDTWVYTNRQYKPKIGAGWLNWTNTYAIIKQRKWSSAPAFYFQ